MARKYPPLSCALLFNGTELNCSQITLDFARSQPVEWSANLNNSNDALYAPGGDVGADFKCNPYNASYAVQNSLTLTGTVGGQPLAVPKLLQLDYQSNSNPSNSFATIQGSDLTEMLLTPDQVMGDVTGTSAKDAVKETLAAYGAMASSWTGFSDYIVAKQHRMGAPLEWIEEMLEIRQAWWQMVGNTFTVRNGGEWTTSRPTDWVLRDRELLTGVSLRRSSAIIVNQASIQRVAENTGTALQTDGAGRGWQFVDLAFPCCVAIPQIVARGGTAGDWLWYDESGSIVSTTGLSSSGIYIGGTPVVRGRFTLTPYIPDDGSDVRYDLTVKGTPLAASGVFDPEYNATYTDTADQAIHGIRPYRNGLTRLQIGDQVTALDFVTRFVREGLRKAITANVSTVLNPEIRPGMTVAITSKRDRLSLYKMYVEAVRWLLDFKSGRATMTLDLSRTEAA